LVLQPHAHRSKVCRLGPFLLFVVVLLLFVAGMGTVGMRYSLASRDLIVRLHSFVGFLRGLSEPFVPEF
jgi:hypothetical protein